MLESGIFDSSVHKVWMCFGIYARLPLNAQRTDKAELPMFLAKPSDAALRETCFSKARIKLYGSVGMNPGHQLVRAKRQTH